MPPRCTAWSRAGARLAMAVLGAAASLSADAGAQGRSPAREVRQLWETYLTSKQGEFAARAATPSPHWSAAEQARWPAYDLAGFYLPDKAVPEVLHVAPVRAAGDSVWQIVTRFWPTGASPRSAAAKPVLTMTVYARREGGRWVLANALPFATRAWTRASSGRIEYHVAPALRFDAQKARRAAAFVDSLATAFGVPAPPRVDYYVAESVDQALEILGVRMPQRYGAAGGFAKPRNAQVFSGIPALGEEYRHELVHVVLLPILRDGTTTLLASEGVPTWFGGTAGRDYRGSVRHLDSLLQAQPPVTLDRIVADLTVSADIRNAAGAVLAEMVHEAGGVEAVRGYLRAPGGAMRPTLERLLRRPWPTIAEEWRRRVRRIAAA